MVSAEWGAASARTVASFKGLLALLISDLFGWPFVPGVGDTAAATAPPSTREVEVHRVVVEVRAEFSDVVQVRTEVTEALRFDIDEDRAMIGHWVLPQPLLLHGGLGFHLLTILSCGESCIR